MPSIDVEVIHVTPRVNAKINQLHGVSVVEVEEMMERRMDSRLSPNDAGVVRLLVVGRTESGRLLNAVLYPTDRAGHWNLATAFPVQ